MGLHGNMGEHNELLESMLPIYLYGIQSHNLHARKEHRHEFSLSLFCMSLFCGPMCMQIFNRLHLFCNEHLQIGPEGKIIAFPIASHACVHAWSARKVQTKHTHMCTQPCTNRVSRPSLAALQVNVCFVIRTNAPKNSPLYAGRSN